MVDDLLYFSRSERRLILIASIGLLLFGMVVRIPEPILESSVTTHIDTLDDPIMPSQNIPLPDSIPCIGVDIDQVVESTWIKLGAPKWLARRIERYREKGGPVRDPEDLLRIYDMDTSWVNNITPCIRWRDRTVQRKQKKYPRPNQRWVPKPIYINEADSASWASLPGIGPVLSSRIIRFRERLGGFYKVEQIAETYGLSDSTFRAILPYLSLKSPPLKMDINALEAAELERHPYISKKEARIILRYREQHGPFDSLGQLFTLRGLDTDQIKKWLPYVKVVPK